MRAVILLALCCFIGFAQRKPNFSGTWEMNIEKSTFDKQGPPKGAITCTVDHRDPILTETIVHADPNNPKPGTVKYVTDGTEGSNVVMGNSLKYTAKWDGATLVIETWGNFGPNSMRLIDKWSLSRDGRTLIVERHYEGNGGPQDQKLVFEKKKTTNN